MAILPIREFEDKILETVEENPVAVLIGETGSGKSTQLSQILHKRGYTKTGMIAVTQPRRVAAVSVSRRVAFELGVRIGEEVGYAIRFEDRTSEKTRIKYLTDGVLLRESLSDPELSQYSVIILDEAHERSLNTDILLGLMKRLVKLRSSNLKVLVTSATLDGVKVSNFFAGCPILNIPGTLFPVAKLYSTERSTSYLESSLKTALDIHIREPPGDILLFMTGQDEIEKTVSKLEERIQNLEEGSVMDALVLPLHGSLPPEMQIRSMMFSKDVRKQLSQIIQKIAKGSLDIESGLRQKKSDHDYRKLRRALCKGFGNQLAERMLHHNGYRTLGYRSQIIQVHPSSVLETDEEGQLPDYVVYHELINTSRPFMRNVCAVEMSWVMPILKKIEKMDVNKLSGGDSASVEHGTMEAEQKQLPKKEANGSTMPSNNVDSKIQAARERYLARKAKK